MRHFSIIVFLVLLVNFHDFSRTSWHSNSISLVNGQFRFFNPTPAEGDDVNEITSTIPETPTPAPTPASIELIYIDLFTRFCEYRN
jgi:hypothetical protein